jgi:hypothetical protein
MHPQLSRFVSHFCPGLDIPTSDFEVGANTVCSFAYVLCKGMLNHRIAQVTVCPKDPEFVIIADCIESRQQR